jgi:uncharacterized membrane protein YcaP (DUF421 family)
MTTLEYLSSAMETALGLGLEAKDINVWQMSLRAVVVFAAATAMIRLGSRRFIGRSTALDVMLGIIFGSVVSRAISGNAPFFPTLGAALTLVLVHWLLCAIAFRSHRFGNLVKGRPLLLVDHGKILWRAMAHGHITEHDLQEALRSHGLSSDVTQVETAHLERNGDISIVTRHTIRAESRQPPTV